MSSPTLADCLRSGAAFNAMRCSSCPDLSMVAVHHCERIVVAIGVRCGGLSRADVAELLGISEETVKTHEQNARRKIGRRLQMALEAA